MTRLSQALASCGSMAGTDSGGREWAAAYDEAAGPLLQAGAELGRALAHMGNLLNAALANHEAADGGARLDGAHRSGSTEPGAGASTPTYDVSVPAPTSAFGGNAAEPDGWHWIAEHLEEFVWPDADTDRLRRAGTAWTTAADTLASYASNCSSAADAIGMNHGPEVADAVGACLDLREHVEEIAAAYREVGAACTDYGTHVDAHRDEVVSILVELLAWTVVDQAAGVVLSFFTFGAAEVAAQLVEAGIMARYAVRIIEVLRRLRALARVAVTAVKSAKLRVAARLGRLKTFVTAPIEKALTKVARTSGGLTNQERALYEKYLARKAKEGRPALGESEWKAAKDRVLANKAQGDAFEKKMMGEDGIIDGEGGWASQFTKELDGVGPRRWDYANEMLKSAVEVKSGSTPVREGLEQLVKDEAALRQGWSLTWHLNKELAPSLMKELERLKHTYPNFHFDVVGG